MTDIKYPNIKVKLSGTDGNAFALLGRVARALRENKVPKIEIDKFNDDAMSGDYEHLLATICKMVNVK